MFNFAAAVSLVLCLATVGLWVRSYAVEDEISRGGWDAEMGWRDRNMGVYSAFGYLYPYFKTDDPWGTNAKAKGISISWSWTQAKANPSGNWFGPAPVTVFRIAYWKLALLTTAMTFLWWWRFRENRHRRIGICLTCGYNLTGNTSGTCPECGTPVPKASADKSPRPA
jgi:hypothetical protein